jgi:hypothetical protein
LPEKRLEYKAWERVVQINVAEIIETVKGARIPSVHAKVVSLAGCAQWLSAAESIVTMKSIGDEGFRLYVARSSAYFSDRGRPFQSDRGR